MWKGGEASYSKHHRTIRHRLTALRHRLTAPRHRLTALRASYSKHHRTIRPSYDWVQQGHMTDYRFPNTGLQTLNTDSSFTDSQCRLHPVLCVLRHRLNALRRLLNALRHRLNALRRLLSLLLLLHNTCMFFRFFCTTLSTDLVFSA